MTTENMIAKPQEDAKKTYKECMDFISKAVDFRRRLIPRGATIGDDELPHETHLDFAIDQVRLTLEEEIGKTNCVNIFTREVKKAQRQHASLKDGKFEKDQFKDFIYTPEKLEEVEDGVEAAEKKLNETLITFKPLMGRDIPENLSLARIKAFRGFVIPEDYEVKEPVIEKKGKHSNNKAKA